MKVPIQKLESFLLNLPHQDLTDMVIGILNYMDDHEQWIVFHELFYKYYSYTLDAPALQTIVDEFLRRTYKGDYLEIPDQFSFKMPVKTEAWINQFTCYMDVAVELIQKGEDTRGVILKLHKFYEEDLFECEYIYENELNDHLFLFKYDYAKYLIDQTI